MPESNESLNSETANSESASTEKKSGQLWTIVALLFFAILMTVSYKLKDLLEPSVSASASLDESCDLRKGACVSVLPNGGKVSFSLSPNDIPILRPLKLHVTTEGVKVSTVEVDFVGIGMEMGYNRSSLKEDGQNKFTGKAILPVCVRSKMDWEAKVLLKTDKGLLMAPFRFYTTK